MEELNMKNIISGILKVRNLLKTFLIFLIVVFYLSLLNSCKESRKFENRNVFIQIISQWPPSGKKYYEVQGDTIYFMEEFIMANTKKLYVKKLSDYEKVKLDSVLMKLSVTKLKSRYIDNRYSETATEYHITIEERGVFRNFQISQDSIHGEFQQLISFINSFQKDSFDLIIEPEPIIQDLNIGSIVNHYNDTIPIAPFTRFCVWKQIVLKMQNITADPDSIKEQFDYKFQLYYDLGYKGDSIKQIGVINNNIFVILGHGKIGKVNNTIYSIQPLLY